MTKKKFITFSACLKKKTKKKLLLGCKIIYLYLYKRIKKSHKMKVSLKFLWTKVDYMSLEFGPKPT